MAIVLSSRADLSDLGHDIKSWAVEVATAALQDEHEAMAFGGRDRGREVWAGMLLM